jgi:hypothetical protein
LGHENSPFVFPSHEGRTAGGRQIVYSTQTVEVSIFDPPAHPSLPANGAGTHTEKYLRDLLEEV